MKTNIAFYVLIATLNILVILSMYYLVFVMPKDASNSENEYDHWAVPDGWRYPTINDVEIIPFYEEEINNNNLDRFHASADMNSDEINDDVWFLIREPRNGVGLFVFLSQNGLPRKIIKIYEHEKNNYKYPGDSVLSVLEPGTYNFFSEQGEYKFNLKHPGVQIHSLEKSSQLYYWDELTGSIKEILTSD